MHANLRYYLIKILVYASLEIITREREGGKEGERKKEHFLFERLTK